MTSSSKIAALAAAASLVGFTPAAAVVVEWTVASGGNGHFYERVETPVAFATARAAALASTHNGLAGYLVTVTSEAENEFLINLAGGIGWTSGSDEAVEGTWRWLDGPEAGVIYWQDGVTQTYADWGAGEPNTFRGIQEDYMVIKFGQTAFWNDLPFDSGQGYYVEYSAAPATGGVPEPSAWALMILGFGLAGTAVRSSRRTVARRAA
jgi:hypothetical protein